MRAVYWKARELLNAVVWVVVLSKTDFMHDKDAMAELGQHQELIRNRFLHQIQILM